MYTQVGHLRKPEIETCKMEEYRERAEAGYSHGTLRCGPLQHISVVGQVSEESGGYFPQFLGKLVGGVWGVGSWKREKWKRELCNDAVEPLIRERLQ